MTPSRENIIWDFDRTIISVYNEYSLTSLRGLKDDFIINGRQILQWYFDAVRKGQCKYYEAFNYHQNFDDLIFCSDEIMYFLAHMYLYRPYLNNPVQDGFYFGDGMLYPNYQNLESKRYSMFSNIVSEKLYNYWDRIGDLIATYFPALIKPEQVYFPKAIEIIPKEYHDNENYIWLKEFKENQYRKLNQIRKQAVHYTTEDTLFKHKHLNSPSEKEQMEELFKNRYDLADVYKAQLELTLSGFEKTLLLIETVTEKTLADIP
ncbi:hypothetical protein IQ13_3281 [Lacibacter cauensis]|uniref:Cthe-2314-like HEPN domain-containing protein n=1 Tax=Lacibacter cauensis TaxID=510947 RepID=A0A562SH97_9BACT|nr:Cthe_2314 family HEPN domain-containing protein [Lacibacter cauensis]TWI80602.1 hypothetical protein IQ13_3281 [Lacibacter cauensis]